MDGVCSVKYSIQYITLKALHLSHLYLEGCALKFWYGVSQEMNEKVHVARCALFHK